MKVTILRNKKQALSLCESIMQARLPLKVATQEVFPTRSLESNAYLWGIVYESISQATGHTPLEVHEAYKLMFNFRFDLHYNPKSNMYEWVMGVGSTTTMDYKEIWEYIMKVRADAEIEMSIIIPMPNECFINELEFEHDKMEIKRL